MLIFFTLLFFCHAFADENLFKSCPAIRPMENFSSERIIGTWYQIERTPNTFEADNVCSVANYTNIDDKTLLITGSATNKISGSMLEYRALALPVAHQPLSVHKIVFPNTGGRTLVLTVTLDTDYDNYEVLIGCHVKPRKEIEVHTWIRSRRTSLDIKFLDHAHDVLRNNSLPSTGLEVVDHTRCQH